MSASKPNPTSLYYTAATTPAAVGAAAKQARALGFTGLCVDAAMARDAAADGLDLWLYAALDDTAGTGDEAPPDPRFPGLHRTSGGQDAQAWLERWENRLLDGGQPGVAGLILRLPAWIADGALQSLATALRNALPGVALVAVLDRPRPRLAGFDMVAPAMPWVDALPQAAVWLAGPPLLALAELPRGPRLATRFGNRPRAAHGLSRAIRLAAFSGAGWLLPQGLEDGALHRGGLSDPGTAPRLALAPVVSAANEARATMPALGHATRVLSAPHAPLVLLRQGPKGRALVLANASLTQPKPLAAGTVLGLLPTPGALPAGSLDAKGQLPLSPAEVRIVPVHDTAPVRLPLNEGSAEAATQSPRIAIEAIAPAVDDGRFAVKRAVGQAVTVTADVFTDGHAYIAVRLLWRAGDEGAWNEVPMLAKPNDVWEASFVPDRIGRYHYTVEAWVDHYAAFRNEITKKHAAGIDISLERREGVALLQAAAGRLGEQAGDLALVLETEPGAESGQAVALFTAGSTRAAMDAADPRPHRTRHDPLPLDVERREAGFASWYEIFPRSQTDDPKRHGTFHDVIQQLPRVRDMGFDEGKTDGKL